MLWRPRSILQLVLLGFALVLAPLSGLIFYTLQTLNQQASQGQQSSQQLVNLTRQSQRFDTDLLDMERLARQYATLGEPDLYRLFRDTYDSAKQELQGLYSRLDAADQQLLDTLHQQMAQLAQQLPQVGLDNPTTASVLARFDTLSELNLQLQRTVAEHVDHQLQQHSRQIDELEAWLSRLVSMLALLTLVLALSFIYWISTPIRQLERKITTIGNEEPVASKPISGPLEMQQLGQQLDWLKVQLEQIEQQKQQFLRHMSHELKTPLASLREGADLLAEDLFGQLDGRQREVITIIQQNSWELQRLIENLLDFNRIRQGDELNLMPVSLESLYQELLKPYAVQIKRRRLQIDQYGEYLQWLTDPAKLKTAWDNLISNAVNYCDPDGRILVRWSLEADRLIIIVANTGATIAKHEQLQIFEPFFQGNASRGGAIKGSGIGLSVARECIEAMSGTLTLSSHPEWDTCFRIELPKHESRV